MGVNVAGVDQYVMDMSLRMPFHFGDTAITELPHAFCRIELEVDGETHAGLAAEGLSPLWFIKDPDVGFVEGLDRMVDAMEAAAEFAEETSSRGSPFDLWHAVYERQREWGEAREEYPALLWSFGVTLVERGIVDAFCRARDATFAEAVRTNELGVDLAAVYDDLAGHEPADLLPDEPLRETQVRHTVGFTDPLTEEELSAADRLEDGLPQSLADYVAAQGLRYFKIKLVGDVERDAARLEAIADVLEAGAPDDYRFTLDANEQYDTAADFRDQWRTIEGRDALDDFLDHLLYVEQPIARGDALTEETSAAFTDWESGPPVIIDESDGELRSLRSALDCGYAGTSHKNCKGLFKGLVNRCLVEHRRRIDPDGDYVMSGEDLSTVGPVGLLQDLAAMATLGMDHVERNGHHYFRGLGMLPPDLQDALVEAHGDLYERHAAGFPAVAIEDGAVSLDSVVDAPFGYDLDVDPSRFTPLAEWEFEPAGE